MHDNRCLLVATTSMHSSSITSLLDAAAGMGPNEYSCTDIPCKELRLIRWVLTEPSVARRSALTRTADLSMMMPSAAVAVAIFLLAAKARCGFLLVSAFTKLQAAY